jgi:hypothetical protein
MIAETPCRQRSLEMFSFKRIAMNAATYRLIMTLLPFLTFAPRALMAQETVPVSVEARLDELQSQVNSLKTVIPRGSSEGAALFLYGAFCALWAQNTGRNPWLWFFAGIIFSFVTVLFLLAKNSDDRRARVNP